jgi:hypothetical protein
MTKKTIFFAVVAVMLFMVAVTVHIAAGNGPERGMVMVAAGGGAIDDAEFIGGVGDATFSFFAGYDKKGNLKGSFYFKRLYPTVGVRAIKSTEITDIQTGTDGIGTWVMMTGFGDFMPTWTTEHVPEHPFTLIAWDLDSSGEGVDMIWVEIRRPYPNGTVRPAVSLLEPTEITGGNVLILE